MDYVLVEDKEISVISDMHQSLIHGVSTEFPKTENCVYARHIYACLKKLHKPDTLKPLFWTVAKNYNKTDFKQKLTTIMAFDLMTCDDLLKKEHHMWYRAF